MIIGSSMRKWLSACWLKAAGGVVGATFVALLLLAMFATELTHAFISETAESPIALPQGVDIRYSDRLVSLIGKGTPSGRATAVTLGSVILVPRRFDALTAQAQSSLIRHELVHVQQRDRYGRFYLPVYVVLYVVHGYTDHPFEREATQQPGTPSVNHGVDGRLRNAHRR